MMEEQPKAQNNVEYRWNTGLGENPVTLAQAGIDKNLAHRARGAAALRELREKSG